MSTACKLLRLSAGQVADGALSELLELFEARGMVAVTIVLNDDSLLVLLTPLPSMN